MWASLCMRPPHSLQTRSACSSMRCRPPSSCLASPHSPSWRAPARTLLLPPTPARCRRLWPCLEPGSPCLLPCAVALFPSDPRDLRIESCPSRNVKRAHRDAKHTAVRAEVDEDGLVPTPAKLQLQGAPLRADSSCPPRAGPCTHECPHTVQRPARVPHSVSNCLSRRVPARCRVAFDHRFSVSTPR